MEFLTGLASGIATATILALLVYCIYRMADRYRLLKDPRLALLNTAARPIRRQPSGLFFDGARIVSHVRLPEDIRVYLVARGDIEDIPPDTLVVPVDIRLDPREANSDRAPTAWAEAFRDLTQPPTKEK